ncbi:MAG: hypothetical protein JKX70_08760 [Phycisphaerales bacterium]|nr:hypothetical protein [Phycisphaerales bacterium]
MRFINILNKSILGISILFLQGCTAYQPIAQLQETQVQLNPLHIQIETQDQTLAELFELLDPKFVPALQPVRFQSTAPQLIAGDWLAWQCAIVGNYWDLPLKNSHANAEAFETQRFY